MTRKHAYSFQDLLDSAHGRLFGENAARLPLPPMLMVDRITHIDDTGGSHGRGAIVAEMDVRPDQWFFGCHFVEDPVMPGCLGLDAMWQLLGFFLTWCGGPGKGRALGAGEIRFRGQVLPTSRLVTYLLDIKRLVRRGLFMGIADARMEVDGREIYTASDLRVGLFQNTDDF